MATSDVSISLPPLNLRTAEITVVGDSPLITHKWSEKAQKEMLDKQMKKAKAGREAKDPEEDFRQSLYEMPGGGYGFPVIAFKNAAVTACTSVSGITKVAARQAFTVGGSMIGSELVRIEGCEPTMRQDMVRVGMGTADIRFRGEFRNWWAKVLVRFNANVFSAEQIYNLFNTAGFGVGVGEWRMERDGQFGMFHVADERDREKWGGFVSAYEKSESHRQPMEPVGPGFSVPEFDLKPSEAEAKFTRRPRRGVLTDA